MNMHIVAAVVVIVSFVPCAHASTAPCTLPANLGWKIIGGSGNDNSVKACEAGGTLIHDEECWVMPEGGYTSNTATASATSYKCTNSALNTNDVLIQVTGCKEHYRMSAGSSNADIVCTACEPGKTIATMPAASGVQTCTADCEAATAGSCAMGCGVNFYQSSGTTSSDIKCTACNPGTISLAKPVQTNGSNVCSACDDSVPGDCSTGCAADFYQASGNVSEITCTACSSGTNIAAMPVQSNATSCAVTATTTMTTTTTTMTNTQMVCAVPANATNPTTIAAYVECLGSKCEDASAPWLEGVSSVPDVTCTQIFAASQSNCSMTAVSALGLLMTDMNKSLDADIAQAMELFTVNSVCGSKCGNKCNDGASLPDGTTGGSSDGSALVNAAATTGPPIPFLMLAPTALLLSMCL